MSDRLRIVLVAHDARKQELVDACNRRTADLVVTSTLFGRAAAA